MRNDEKLGTAPLGRLILSLALPTGLTQLINVLYNIVDRIYIGHMQGDGNLDLTGVGFTLPIITLIAAFSAFAGAGEVQLATVISQFVSAVWVVSFLKSKRSVLYLKLVRPDKSLILKIAAWGIAPFVMQSTESLVTITFNTGLQRYGGDLYVGSMSILMSIMQLIFIPVNGITQGVQPIISCNYGAEDMLRVKETVVRLVSVCLLGTLILAGVAIFCPGIYASMFTNDAELVALTCRIMPIFFLGIAIWVIRAACQATFLAFGQANVSLFISTLRKIILLIPLALILPKFSGVKGIYIAEPVSDVISVIVTVITLKRIFIEMEDKS